MVLETAWLPLAVGQLAALAGESAASVMIMTEASPSAARPPVSARRRARGRASEVMSRFLLACRGWGVFCGASSGVRGSGGQSFPAPAPAVTEATTLEAGSAVQP